MACVVMGRALREWGNEACSGYVVMAYVFIAYIVMAYVIMAYIVMARTLSEWVNEACGGFDAVRTHIDDMAAQACKYTSTRRP